MTEYIDISVKKREFNVHIDLPDTTNSLQYYYLHDSIRISRDYDFEQRIDRSGNSRIDRDLNNRGARLFAERITRDGDIRITRNRTLGYPRAITVHKKDLIIRAGV